MDRTAELARTLNLVTSVGQARAALRIGISYVDSGVLLASDLNFLTSPTEDEAKTLLTIERGQLVGELNLISAREETGDVDAGEWARQRRAIERAYVDVSGIEGVVGALARVSLVDELGTAIVEAPGVIGHAVGQAAGAVAPAAFGLTALVVVVLILLVFVKERAT